MGELTSAYWVVNSCSSAHLLRESTVRYEWEECDDPDVVTLPNNSKLRVARRGNAHFEVHTNGKTYWIELKDARYAPQLAMNLII